MLLAAPPDLATQLDEMLRHIRDGRILGAFRQFYASDVRMQENEQPPVIGFQENLARTRAFLSTVGRWHGFTVLARGVGSDHTFYDSISEWSTTGGQRIRRRQVSVAHWRDGLIIAERFVYLSGG